MRRDEWIIPGVRCGLGVGGGGGAGGVGGWKELRRAR